MNNKVMWLLVVIALGVGAYGGYLYEKNKFVGLMNTQRIDMQRQIDDAKKMSSDRMMEDPIVMMSTNDKLGSYATNTKGMALYTYDKDTKGKSNCVDACAEKWPPYVGEGTLGSSMKEHLGTIERADGSMQYTWDGKPLYYYAADKDKDDVSGDGVGGVWHVVK